jgi:hypothetical protein
MLDSLQFKRMLSHHSITHAPPGYSVSARKCKRLMRWLSATTHLAHFCWYVLLQSDKALSAVSKRLRRAKGACLRRLHNLVTLHTSKGQENHLSREKENAGIYIQRYYTIYN